MQIKFNATEEQVKKIINLFAGFICKSPLENPDGSKQIGALTMGTDGTLYCSTALKGNEVLRAALELLNRDGITSEIRENAPNPYNGLTEVIIDDKKVSISYDQGVWYETKLTPEWLTLLTAVFNKSKIEITDNRKNLKDNQYLLNTENDD